MSDSTAHFDRAHDLASQILALLTDSANNVDDARPIAQVALNNLEVAYRNADNLLSLTSNESPECVEAANNLLTCLHYALRAEVEQEGKRTAILAIARLQQRATALHTHVAYAGRF